MTEDPPQTPEEKKLTRWWSLLIFAGVPSLMFDIMNDDQLDAQVLRKGDECWSW